MSIDSPKGLAAIIIMGDGKRAEAVEAIIQAFPNLSEDEAHNAVSMAQRDFLGQLRITEVSGYTVFNGAKSGDCPFE
ncbi:hypothetical protein [Ruegeria lacuscaerulensis]|uniref:hypothetical protein n=1 Tax=Ruegeria lacuscaerulensis TaxID=55218 RepID=UPI00147CC9BE|nr:hypothetical protein [Ruegeria lacuscaerulensis]